MTHQLNGDIGKRLRGAGLRPTRQRLGLARLLFEGPDRHVTAEALHAEALLAGLPVSLATVYNTLHQFTTARLMREVLVDGAKTYFDTNTGDHHHFYLVDRGEVSDIPANDVALACIPQAPEGTAIERVDVVVRVSKRR